MCTRLRNGPGGEDDEAGYGVGACSASCTLHIMMEEGLLKDLELVENELLVVRTQLDDLLQVR